MIFTLAILQKLHSNQRIDLRNVQLDAHETHALSTLLPPPLGDSWTMPPLRLCDPGAPGFRFRTGRQPTVKLAARLVGLDPYQGSQKAACLSLQPTARFRVGSGLKTSWGLVSKPPRGPSDGCPCSGRRSPRDYWPPPGPCIPGKRVRRPVDEAQNSIPKRLGRQPTVKPAARLVGLNPYQGSQKAACLSLQRQKQK